ncbi:bifunctional 4-hydroxy-2-oxoglutarate aldolase/2-dehydro-3-deoxy-phosphogluconate aldolase [Paraflavitalea sp. CAU 1676]|uniref:bifunctional 4-hydroxy-2-oxoglutarate aldolase/2-dehydro-3-deoxy-phosphogluconate aldolase n=1 Tax=Paraflavitalea sp. CAU 1676 TaxID=3032598 RepID=UPI0023DCDBBA|nr:bifunctional 4-hydroxy-2-oxoglutarate aldolase/2-dehydro-3-deoxy-phosphogluconate aldolase [Paraflavitalea sp. CAU 1676]MDF2189580.1 bifunctional 4-hydroxy-2-oxoglutarate aldolase/2-dehydro-3-deoxy-phosphogluconate aldolase [Paraflavitalea sp. CAU 1676]
MNAIIKRIEEQGVLPLYFHPDATVSVEVLKALYAAGIRAVEYTNRGEEALENFKLLKETRDQELPELLLGIGTIKRKKEAKAFMKAGADFIIAPGMIEEVAETVLKEEMVWIPGCMTTTEIIRAEDAGAKLIKLFPGNLLGPSFVSAIKELFPGLKFMPTGGVEVSKDNLTGWFKSGVVAVGMGSKLITKEILEKKEYETLITKTKEAMALVKEVRGH